MSNHNSRFFEYDGKWYPVVSGGRVATTTLWISDGVADRANLQIRWTLNFSNPGLGLTASDITPTPSTATVSVGGRGNIRTVTLTVQSVTDVASFVIAADAFSDRLIVSPESNRTSNSVALAETTTVTIGSPNTDTGERTISWTVTFSNAGAGFTIDDITPTPSDAARLITGSGNTYVVSLRLAGFSSRTGNASFVIGENPFTDRVFASSVSQTDRTSSIVAFNFPNVTPNELPTAPVAPEFLAIPPAYMDDFTVILGNVDISDRVVGLSNITRTLDDGRLYHFRIAEASVTVVNEAGEFSSYNDQNEFVRAGEPQVGYRAAVRILHGTNLIFAGEILEIHQNEESADQRWVISDATLDINQEDVENFGLTKRVRLAPHNRAESSQTGIYPFPTALSPPSTASASGVSSATLHPLYFDEHLDISGIKNPRNVEINGNELHTQGGYLSLNDDPIITFKSPLRYHRIDTLVSELLSHYGLHQQEIQVNPITTTDSEYHSLGRVGYAVEAEPAEGERTSSTNPEWHWEGYATDFVYDPNGVNYLPPTRAMTEHQGSLYVVSGSNLYRINADLRTFKDLGNIADLLTPPTPSLSRARVMEGLASVQGKLVLLTRRDLYYIHIDSDDVVSVKRLILDGHGTSRGQINQEGGWATGLTNRGDELFIGKRQQLFRAELSGIHAELYQVLGYGDFPDITNITANNIEYLDGTFYTTGRQFLSFDMESGYTPTNPTSHAAGFLSAGPLARWNGNLLGRAGGYLAYINGQEGRVRETLTNPTFYFLYSARQSTTRPKILRYQVLSDTWDVLYEHPTHAEFWQLQTDDFLTFHVMGTDAQFDGSRPLRAAYNALHHRSATPNTNTIWRFNSTADPPTFEERVSADALHRPQIAQYYHLGFQGGQNRYGFLPDNRKRIQSDLTNIYYTFVTDTGAGVAQLDSSNNTTAMLTAPLDNWHNECGVGFTINDGTIYAGFTFIDEAAAESTLKIVTRSLGRLPRFARFVASTNLTEGTAYDESVFASGDPIPTITSALTGGTLPTGLTREDDRLHGTPTGIPATGQEFQITFTATNNRGSIPLVLNFRVADENAAAPVFAAFTATTLTENVAYDQSITATGTPTPTITATHTALPTGITVDGARVHGTPTGIPDDGSTFSVFWTATNSEGSVQTTVAFTVAGA